jgi:hypothetical protein
VRLRLFLPLVLLIAVFAGWSAFWFYAAREAERQLDGFIASQARAGTTIGCAERTIGGYPFRLELRCGATALTVRDAEGTLEAGAAGLAAVVQLPNPNHLIWELASPVTLDLPDGTRLTASFTALRSSVHLQDNTFARSSLQIEQPSLVVTRADTDDALGAIQGRLLDVFVRRPEDKPAGTVDMLAKLVGGQSPLAAGTMGAETGDLELQAELLGAGPLADGVTPDALRAFAAGGGKLDLVLLRATQGDVVAEAKGMLGLNDGGSAEGTVTMTVANMGKLAQALTQQGVQGLYSAIALGRAATLDGKPATSYAVTVDDGRVSVGSLSLGTLPPAF